MALFGSKKKKDEKVAAPAVKEGKAAGTFDVTAILRGPRITEKASQVAERNVYVFNVSPSASKKAVAFAVSAQYNVQPIRVRVASVKAKKVFSRGKKGMVGAGKKAYVYLKQGQTIQLS